MRMPAVLSFTSQSRSERGSAFGQLAPTCFATEPGAKEGASLSKQGGRVPERISARQGCQHVYQRKLGLCDSGPGPGTLHSEPQFPP